MPPQLPIEAWLADAVSQGASDVHLRVGQPPLARRAGHLAPLQPEPLVTSEALDAFVGRWLSEDQRGRLAAAHDVDTTWAIARVGRCRASVFHERGRLAVALRLIPDSIPDIDALGLPASVTALAQESRGLVLVTGATGSGKSTTLAALVSAINRSRSVHILTIEDPIEFLHSDVRAVITQREVGIDVASYASGLRSALRQDPDVILLGELRDAETIETALVAAETGHLVLSTLHTLDAAETINRIVSVFAPHHQGQIRHQLARVLRAAVSQRLIPRADGAGRALAAEVLVNTPYVRECIADRDKTSLLPGAIVSGAHEYGMQSFDQSILGLTDAGLVAEADALRWVSNVDEFRMRRQGISPGRR